MGPSPLPGVHIWLRLIGYGIAALCGVVIQLVLMPSVAIGGIAPDVLLVIILWIALRHGPVAGALAGFIIGLLVDAVLPGALGINSFAKTVAGFVGGLFAEPGLDNPLTLPWLRLSAILALSSAVQHLLYYALLLHPLDVSLGSFLLTVAGATGYSLVVGALIAMVAKLWRGRDTISEQ